MGRSGATFFLVKISHVRNIAKMCQKKDDFLLDGTPLEDLNTNRITRILTTDFPQYFAVITRIRQELHTIGPDGGLVNSSVVPQVYRAIYDTKTIYT